MIEVNEFKGLISEGMSIRAIARLKELDHNRLTKFAKINNIPSSFTRPEYKEDYFEKINTPAKAYLLGFMLGDGCLQNNGRFSIGVALRERETLYLMQSEFNCNVKEYYKTNRDTKSFPRARVSIKNKKIHKDLHKLFGGFKKEDRHIPIVSNGLKKYLLLGFFDAEGCVTFGMRKDRNRLWKKIQFTSQYKLLIGIQKILANFCVASSIHPKGNEKCFVLYVQTAYTFDLARILNISNFPALKRKQDKLEALLRLESDENGGNYVK